MRLLWERLGVQEVVAYLALAALTGVCASYLAQVVLTPPGDSFSALHYAPDRHARLGQGGDLVVLLAPAAGPGPLPTAEPPAAAEAPVAPIPTVAAPGGRAAARAVAPADAPHLAPSSAGRGALPDRPVHHVRARVLLESVRFVPRRAEVPPRSNHPAPRGEEGAPLPLVATAAHPLSTPSPDPRGGSWREVRDALRRGRLPDPGLVQPEDLVNAQASDLPLPPPGTPVAVDLEAAPHPWHPGRHLLRVGLRAALASSPAPGPSHLTVVVDTSGSMALDGRLDHVKLALGRLVDGLGADDRLSLVSYADVGRELVRAAGPDQAGPLRQAIASLRADGASAQAAGLRAGWQLAQGTWAPGTDQRVILLTDGEANLAPDQLDPVGEEAAAWAARSLRLDVVAVGLGDEADARAAQLAALGGGRLWSLDGYDDAEALAARLRGASAAPPRDVRVSVAFDSQAVPGWRLVGHDGGGGGEVPPLRLAPGQGLAALYELALAPTALVGQLDGVLAEVQLAADDGTGEPLRWVVEVPARIVRSSFAAASRDLRVGLAAARFGSLLRAPPADPEPWLAVAALAEEGGRAQDRELAGLVRQAGRLASRTDRQPPAPGGPGLDARDSELLSRRLLRAQGTVEPCAVERGATGALAVGLVLDAGVVVDVAVAHDGGDHQLEACVAQVAADWRFPSAWSAELTVPVLLAQR